MDRYWEDRFPELVQFFGCYFHEDFLTDYGSWEAALEAAIGDLPADLRQEVLRELDAFAACALTDAERKRIVFQIFGLCFHVEARGFTTVTWLAYVRRHLAEALGADARS